MKNKKFIFFISIFFAFILIGGLIYRTLINSKYNTLMAKYKTLYESNKYTQALDILNEMQNLKKNEDLSNEFKNINKIIDENNRYNNGLLYKKEGQYLEALTEFLNISQENMALFGDTTEEIEDCINNIIKKVEELINLKEFDYASKILDDTIMLCNDNYEILKLKEDLALKKSYDIIANLIDTSEYNIIYNEKESKIGEQEYYIYNANLSDGSIGGEWSQARLCVDKSTFGVYVQDTIGNMKTYDKYIEDFNNMKAEQEIKDKISKELARISQKTDKVWVYLNGFSTDGYFLYANYKIKNTLKTDESIAGAISLIFYDSNDNELGKIHTSIEFLGKDKIIEKTSQILFDIEDYAYFKVDDSFLIYRMSNNN